MCSEHGDLTTCNKVPRISTEQRHAEVPSAPNGDTRCFPLTLCRYLFCVYQERRYYASQITIHGKTNASGDISKESLLRMIQYSPCQRQAAAWGLVPAALQPCAHLQEHLGSRAAWCRGCVQQAAVPLGHKSMISHRPGLAGALGSSLKHKGGKLLPSS